MRKKVALLFGGKSFEHDVSIESCKCIYEHIDKRLFSVSCIYIDQENRFFEAPSCVINQSQEIENPILYLESFDVVFPVLHGSYGEDGTLQGMLDFFSIPYVGSKTCASAIGMDKVITKILAKNAGVCVVPYVVVSNKPDIKELEKLGYPMIVKPVHGGSSVGVSKVGNRKELKKAIQYAKNYDTSVLVEKYIEGRELECAVLDDKNLSISSVGEIFSTHDFYDYDAKYQSDTKTSNCALLEDSVKDTIREYAKKVFLAIGAKGFARVDFFYDGETVYFNEINTLPGFTKNSMYPQLFQDKYSYEGLLTILLKRC